MSEEREAGQLILSQLGMFNEAVVLYENVIEPAIAKGFDKCIETFANDNEWSGEYEFHTENSNCWLAPKQWITNPGDEKPEFKAWFELDCVDGDGDFWGALFCRVGTKGGEAGFAFEITPSCFGGKNAWKACAKQIPQEVIAKLGELGFKNKNNGRFFLPVYLDNQQLAQSWLDYGVFTHDDDSLAPLRNALEKLKDAAPLFDGIVKGCVTAVPVKD